MTSWHTVRLAAGAFILLSLAIGNPGSAAILGQWWLAFATVTAFAAFVASVSANPLQGASKMPPGASHPARTPRACGGLK